MLTFLPLTKSLAVAERWFRQSGSRLRGGSPRRPLRVFPQTMCGPAEVTGRTCLLVETRRKEGNLRESDR